MFWFFSTSWQFYNPIGLLGRMILMLVPIASVLSAINLDRACQKPIYFVFFSLGFAFCAAIVYYFYASKLVFIYALLSFLMGGYGYLTRQKIVDKSFIINGLTYFKVIHSASLPKKVLAWLLFLVLLIHPTYALVKPSETNYQAEKIIFQQYFKQSAKQIIVFTDVFTLHSLKFSFLINRVKIIVFWLIKN